MDLKAYQGGSGGKVRRHPFRGPSAKPYERQPTAVRAPHGPPTDAGNSGGWLSKLMYPATVFVAASASWLFSSVFRQRQSTPAETITAAPIESQIQGAVCGHNPTMGIGTSDISEIAQLIKQKTYTRAQADYLAGVIRSRLYEPSIQKKSEVMNKNPDAPEELKEAASLAEINEACISGRRGLSAIYPIPKPLGRSTIYRLSRPYYFKQNPAAASVCNFGPIPSPMATVSTLNADNRVGLKRRASCFDIEDGPSQPKRVIR